MTVEIEGDRTDWPLAVGMGWRGEGLRCALYSYFFFVEIPPIFMKLCEIR